ncbi:MAG: hypothetical protein IPN59_14300 [Holophaga sp.]|nr:hypothetical protein [Holophaga sp.]
MPDRDEVLDWLKAHALLLGVGLLLGAWGCSVWLDRPLHPPPGRVAAEEPTQGPPAEVATWRYLDYRFTSLATFELRARVLSKERYRWDHGAALSPIDFALGWGPMSDSAVLDQIRISQSDRWYHWRVSTPPIPLDQISAHSANMHLIPANAHVKRILLEFREGQVVHLRGQLVSVEGPGGFHWTSSLSRLDTGDGSCELIWVEQAGP